ncbi:MAG: YlbF family regulator [Lachnospiraceae bacterium]|uniref:YlbF family regulator n=1 Tax=Parablautia sp. Marseille-Q6255 TaxID=3039593 RepID=UPI0024BC5B70|nr:YlbF family regulator [Parablautia sp. Marseille-Q6255]
MDRVEQCTQELIRAIQQSSEYTGFCAAREKLRTEPQLRREVNEFRLGVFAVQNSQEPIDQYEEQQRLCREGEKFKKNPLVYEFLHTELAVCRLLQKTAVDIIKAVDLDIDEIAERIGL